MKHFYFLSLMLIFGLGLQSQITDFPYTEGFEESVFPPDGWIGYPLVEGDREFERVTVGEWPDCLPHDGSTAMAQYNSFNAQAGDGAVLISPALALTDDNVLRFWFFRSEDPSNNRRDRIEVYYNDTPDLEGATLLDSVNRAMNFYPVVPFEDWYQYSFEFSSPQNTYIIFKAVSAYGWKMFLDDVVVETNSIDVNPPEVIALEGTQVYAHQQMNLTLRVRDQSSMPETLDGEAVIDGNTLDVLMTKTSGTQGDFIYEGTLAGQPDHTEGEIRFWLTDNIGNATWSDSYPLHWDWVQPMLEEGFEGEDFPPENWEVTGKPLTWLTWDDYGVVYYTDSDAVEYVVTPPEGERQAAVEWDFTGNAQDEWMISPIVAITQEAVLTFKNFVRLNSYDYDDYFVKITTDGFSWTTLWSAADYPAGVSNYDEDISLNLDGYVGEDIRIAWQASNQMGTNLWYSWFVDDVKIRASDTLVGIQEKIVTFDCQAYPNPFQQLVHLNFYMEQSSSVMLSVFDNQGKCMLNQESYFTKGNQSVALDGSAWMPGFYTYRMSSNDGCFTGKLVRR